uniref:Uncharacterized protein n=1 Tax=Anguilla anguilla TaxID=7936 RepID=A0A0E9VHN8_ANGAN
MQASLSSA